MTFGEYRSRVRAQSVTRNLAIPYRIALDLLRADATKGGLKGKHKKAAWDDSYMTKLLGVNVG